MTIAEPSIANVQKAGHDLDKSIAKGAWDFFSNQNFQNPIFFNLPISTELSTVCLYCKNEVAIVLLAECNGSSHVLWIMSNAFDVNFV